MILNAVMDRTQDAGAGADLIGQRRQAQRHAFPGEALGETIERLMLTERNRYGGPTSPMLRR